jgi:hypothetical protein
VQNILNTNYRDYLNRQRFFADEMGELSNSIKIQLLKIKIKKMKNLKIAVALVSVFTFHLVTMMIQLR